MTKLRIEHGASKLNWVLLKTNIEESISEDIDRMCEWSNNDRKYVVNELLRFALTQSEAFQEYKTEPGAKSSPVATDAKPRPSAPKATPDPVPSVPKPAPDAAVKPTVPATATTNRQ
jgi:hypothetical protein